jgi:hypothetical protein
MSILSQLLTGKMTFSQAVSQSEAWFSTLISKAPPAVQVAAASALSDFKQAASDAVTMADTALGPILSVGVLAIEGATTTALVAAVGPASGTELSAVVDAGITAIANGFHAQVDAEVAQFRASIVSTPLVAKAA